ncbi:hypothetical protein EDD21DRAFT_365318 [Dissophora ornata]|nr:hypothetical protein BGZ58_004621 [Dissophora ornata]KAI8604814.1 hypothetical protein EDD21DRAFT_365318 [Dissophora ornata]
MEQEERSGLYSSEGDNHHLSNNDRNLCSSLHLELELELKAARLSLSERRDPTEPTLLPVETSEPTTAKTAVVEAQALDATSNLEQEQEQQHISTIHPDLLPVNWPKHVKYLVDYEYHPSIPPFVLDLVQGRRRKKNEQRNISRSEHDPTRVTGLGNSAEIKAMEGGETNKEENEEEEEEEEEGESEPRSVLESEYDDIPIGHAIPGILRSVPSSENAATSQDNCSSSSSQSPGYEIQLIVSPPTHPVLGSYGLFATRDLRPGLHLLDYISLVVPDQFADPNSDHTLYLSNDLNLDASVTGNHGRFVNDFRIIRTHEQGPNVGWDLYRDLETGQIRMGCKVLKRIRKGEEILCTYGKAYWKSRGIVVTGNEWEDDWDTDLDDWSEDDDQENMDSEELRDDEGDPHK